MPQKDSNAIGSKSGSTTEWFQQPPANKFEPIAFVGAPDGGIEVYKSIPTPLANAEAQSKIQEYAVKLQDDEIIRLRAKIDMLQKKLVNEQEFSETMVKALHKTLGRYV